MIGHLHGQLLSVSPGLALLDVGGVGYEVHVPLSTYYELEQIGAGGSAKLHIYTHVREDSLALYGFLTPREKGLFERLIAVSGIGPRLALAVLSGLSPDDLVAALSAADIRQLSSIPGVGKKTAERMALELQDKVRDLAEALPLPAASADHDLLPALLNLGYRRNEAERAIRSVTKEHPGLAFPEMLRHCLKQLSRA